MANKRQDAGVPELYDSEKVKVQQIRQAMMLKHTFRGVRTLEDEENIKRAFTEEATNRCAEIGFGAEVEWVWESDNPDDDPPQSPWVDDDPNNMDLIWHPRIVITERFDKGFQFDHERQQREVASGVLDGQPGYIREDGSKREDPIRKTII